MAYTAAANGWRTWNDSAGYHASKYVGSAHAYVEITNDTAAKVDIAAKEVDAAQVNASGKRSLTVKPLTSADL